MVATDASSLVDRDRTDGISSILGWVSLGLGAAEVIAPRWVARTAGMNDESSGVLRLCGMREIASGVAVLGGLGSASHQAGLWSRVAGDAMDLALLTRNQSRGGSNNNRLKMAASAVLGISALDMYCAMTKGSSAAQQSHGPISVTESIAINRSPNELYRRFRELNRMPEIFSYLESVAEFDERHSRWSAKTPNGETFQWDSEITRDEPGDSFAWRSLEGSDITYFGEVSFEPLSDGHGTAVTLSVEVEGPNDEASALIKKYMKGIGKVQLRNNLRRLKQTMEQGDQRDAPVTYRQSAGVGRTDGHPVKLNFSDL